MQALTNQQLRTLKGRGQLLKPMLRVGKEGLTGPFLTELDRLLAHHELVKVKFDYFKEEKKELSPQLAERTGSRLILRVGNVAVLYRPKPPEDSPE